jgi:hypothetical protein
VFAPLENTKSRDTPNVRTAQKVSPFLPKRCAYPVCFVTGKYQDHAGLGACNLCATCTKPFLLRECGGSKGKGLCEWWACLLVIFLLLLTHCAATLVLCSPIGRYKARSTCSLCPAGKYNSVVGGIKGCSLCAQCGPMQTLKDCTSTHGPGLCFCPSGRYTAKQKCLKCQSGYFNTFQGNTVHCHVAESNSPGHSHASKLARFATPPLVSTRDWSPCARVPHILLPQVW